MLQNKTPTFNVKIMNANEMLYEGLAKSVTSKNDTNKFDILPGHTNFISIIKEYFTLITPDGEKKDYEVENGIVMVYKNDLKVFLGIKQTFQPEKAKTTAKASKKKKTKKDNS